ncbi:MAG: hypothetical protein ACRCW2_03190 [Cellulosilyticaceae bacterium]
MKRKIAMLLAIVMLINVWPAGIMFAKTGQETTESVYGFVTRSYGINFGSESPTPDIDKAPPLLADQAGVQWQVSNTTGNYKTGLYRMNYYLYNGGTYRVQLDVGIEATKATIEVRLYDKNDVPVSVKYTQLNVKDKVPVEDTKYIKELPLEQMAEDRELELQVGNYTVIKLQIKQGLVQVTTTGIGKGYMTPYTLELCGDDGSSIGNPEETLTVFQGLTGLKVTPQHLYVDGGVLKSKDILTTGDDVPGSKPGIKLAFQMPKILQGREFAVLPSGQDEYVTLNLREAFENQVGGGQGMPKQVSFKLSDGAGIYDGYELGAPGTELGQVSLENEQISFYVVADKAALGDRRVVGWPQLQSGMLMQALITLKGGQFAELTQQTFRPVNLAHTYIYYEARKIEGGEIAFQITPYQINGPVTYQLHYQEAGSDSAWIPGPSVYYENGSSKDKKLTLTTRASNTSYKITVTTGGKENESYTYESQILKYDPSTEATPPPLPEIVGIENVYVVPDPKNPQRDQPPAIGFDLQFRAPSTQDLEIFLKDNGALYYELFLHDSDRENSKLIKVFKVSMGKDESGQDAVMVVPYMGGSESGSYNTRQDLFTMQNVQLKHNGQTGWEWINAMPDNYLSGTTYPQPVPSVHTMGQKVPGTYYLSMRAVSEPGKKSGEVEKSLAVSEVSNLKSLALDVVNELIPTPKNLDSVSASVQDTIAQKVLFDYVDLSRYIRYMLDPIGLQLEGGKGSRTYEIYLYQDEAMKEGDLGQFTTIPKGMDGNYQVSEAQLEEMRQGKHALKFEHTSASDDTNTQGNVTISGLEPNAVYYAQIRVRLNVLGDDFSQMRYSLFSKVLSFTTSTKPLPPRPDEQVPPAPPKFFVDTYMNNTTVKLGWEPPTLDDAQKQDVFYEFIRSTDKQIPKASLIREKTLLELLKEEGTYKGFKTYAPKEDKPLIHMYNGSSFEPLMPEQLAADLRLTDHSLAPNTVYYYYVRTVQYIEGKAVASDWIMVPATTTPVNAPIKLSVESPENYKYDPKRETVVSFWAPVPSDGKVPDEYSFDIAVKGEKDDDFRLDYKVVQVKEEPIDAFYRKFVYRVEGLKPGMRYDIKVRLKDKTKPKPEGGDYPSSLYCDKVMFRTEFDDDEQAKDEAYEEYLKKYDEEAEKLKRQPYWEVGDEKYRQVYKYRQTYMKSELGMQSVYSLATSDRASQLYYYLPADVFKVASQSKTMLEIQIEETTILLRPQTLSEKNKDVIEAVMKMDEKTIKDYLIGVEVLLYSGPSTIYGAKTVSPQITLNLELVYTDEEDRLIEDDILSELITLIDKGRLGVIDDLERELDKGKIAEERLDAIIEKEMTTIKDKHRGRTKQVLKSAIDRERSVSAIEQPALITQQIQGSGVDAYYSNGNWEKVYVMMTKGGYAIEATRLGTYVFTGKSSLSPEIPDVPGASDLISKYQLTDFIGTTPEKLGWYVTKSQAYGSVARVLGASRGVDYVEYLRQRGMSDINRIGINSAMRQDELIYLVMQAYEKIQYKSVNQIVIMNKQIVSNIGAFQPKYRQYVYSAAELGVIQPTNGRVSPSDGVTTKAFLQILSKIVAK